MNFRDQKIDSNPEDRHSIVKDKSFNINSLVCVFVKKRSDKIKKQLLRYVVQLLRYWV